MPGMDGYETAALIRSRKRTPRHADRLPDRRSSATRPHIFQAYSAGAVDVVFKPVDPFILRSKVQVLVDLYLKTEEVKRQADLPAVAAGRERPGQGREGCRPSRRCAAPRRGRRRSCSPCRSSSTRAASSRPSRRCSSATASRRSPASRPSASPTSRSSALSRIHPDDLATVVERAIGGAARPGAYSLRVPLALRRRPVPGAAGPGRAGAQRGRRGRARSSASSSTPPTAAAWRSSSPRPARWRRSASSPAASPTTSTTC